MPEYNFSTLSPSDFERLVADLLRARHGWNLEVFGHGPDGGVDLRGWSSGRKIVIQCKHYRGSTWHDLKKSAIAEVRKMCNEKPERYLFATSQDLSKTRKDELQDILSPWIAESSDLLCMKDINALLSEYPQVEKQHFKLWLASAEVLTRIVHSGIWERSEALMEEVQDRVKLYTRTGTYRTAYDLLINKHVAIITGAPGVGKSMLADMIALTYWEAGWQIINLPSHRIDQCWDVWNRDAQQLFYFDDVFGQTDIAERLTRDTGSTVSQLIHRVAGAPNKRLVITTRTHVLREAEARDEPLARSGIKAAECVVAISDYGIRQRAYILYNHLYFSNQDRAVIQEFVRNSYQLSVLKHDNFNPRIIEQLLLKQRHRTAKDLKQRIITTFERWPHSLSPAPGQRYCERQQSTILPPWITPRH
ncbi:MAG: restriction endonuclease [Actinobacteria bacterium]|nr:restriction endonuclease [Actinomycetota bacterium]